MFIMTSEILIGKYIVKPNAAKWKRGVAGYADTCTISLPKLIYAKAAKSENSTDFVYVEAKPAELFKEGDKVSVSLGYDYDNKLRFLGFVKVLNFTEKLEIQCEGYSYLLPKEFNKSYQNTTAKKILQDLVKGTEIKLSGKIEDVKIDKAYFKNASGRQVLEWLEKEFYLSVFFVFDTLYAGLKYGLKNDKNPVKLRINWNVAEDKNFKKKTIDKDVLIKIVEKNSEGEVKKTKSDQKKYSQTKELKIHSNVGGAFKKAIANQEQANQNYRGYQGSVTAFLEPEINPGDIVQIIDAKYPEREGLFFAEQVEGSFSASGGRQTITLNYFYQEK